LGGINMQPDSIKDSTRYIVSTLHHGSILPGNRAEMWRSVFLESGANINGGIWGDNLTILGPDIFIDNSVFVRGYIQIKKNKKIIEKGKEVTFNSVVSTNDSIVIEDCDFRTRFTSDIYAKKINLNKAIVYGNLYCKSAQIKNSIVLGGIYCEGELRINNSIVFTFDADSVKIGKDVFLLSPYGISTKPIELEKRAKNFKLVMDTKRRPNDQATPIYSRRKSTHFA